MDATAVAINLMQHQAAVQRLDVTAKLVKQNELSKQGLLELIEATADAAGLYSPDGNVLQQGVGGNLDRRA